MTPVAVYRDFSGPDDAEKVSLRKDNEALRAEIRDIYAKGPHRFFSRTYAVNMVSCLIGLAISWVVMWSIQHWFPPNHTNAFYPYFIAHPWRAAWNINCTAQWFVMASAYSAKRRSIDG